MHFLAAVGDRWRTESLELNQIFCKQQVECPIQGHAQFLLKTRQLAQVDCPPQPPSQEAGEVYAKNICNAGASSDRRQLANGGERKRLLLSTAYHGGNVMREGLALA